MIRLYDTPSGEARLFEPHDPSNVRMYVCGPTVYDVPHIGNARTAVVFDVLFRLLRSQYGEDAVHYARNYTDIDDKIIVRAKELDLPIDELTGMTIAQYEDAMSALNVLSPTAKPRATQHLDDIRSLIADLLAKGYAYVADGHVMFDVAAFASAQLFAKKKMTLLAPDNTSLREGARVQVASYKRDARDFVLWKPSKTGEPSYEGPEGLPGRPGWHIECSAMIPASLGQKSIDIHGGGNDLVFPHHQCEVMQSESVSGEPLARHWVHSGMLTVDGQKMSKSAGNFITVPDVLARFPGETLRYFFLTGHYRQPLDFTWENLQAAHAALQRLYRALEKAWDAPEINYSNQMVESNLLRSDINTPMALAAVHEFADWIFQGRGDIGGLKIAMLAGGRLLGILEQTPAEWFRARIDSTYVETEIARRQIARDNRDFTTSDQIRDELAALGVVLEDSPTGTRWSVG